MNGQNTNNLPKWIGISGIKDILTKTEVQLDKISQAYPSAFSNNDWASKDSADFEKSLSDSYSSFSASTLNNPNPANSLKGGVSKITPIYIKLYGNYKEPNTALNTVYKEFDLKISGSITLMNRAKEYSTNLNAYMSDIKNTLRSIRSNVDSFTSSFDKISTDVIDTWIDAQNRANDNGVAAFLALFGICVLIAVFSTICLIFFAICCKVQCLRIPLHVMWNLTCLIMILTFLLGGVFGLLGLVGVDGVPVIKWIFGTENLQSSDPKIVGSGASARYINTCINGNGDLSKEFIPANSNANYLDQLYQVSYNLSVTSNTIETYKKSEAIKKLNSFYTSAINDVSLTTDQTLGNNDISSIYQEFRKWTDVSSNPSLKDCSPNPQDVWVQSQELCPGAYTYVTDGAVGNKNCLAYTKFSASSVSSRYSSLSGCKYTTNDFSSVSTSVSAYTSTLNSYISENTALLNQLINNNNVLDASFSQMAVKLSDSLNKIKGVIDPLYNLFQEVVGSNGLFTLVNCSKFN